MSDLRNCLPKEGPMHCGDCKFWDHRQVDGIRGGCLIIQGETENDVRLCNVAAFIPMCENNGEVVYQNLITRPHFGCIERRAYRSSPSPRLKFRRHVLCDSRVCHSMGTMTLSPLL